MNPKIELTFANGLRSFLRQDPDVIMVGEIRDLETAEIAIQASLTGHLVLSTLHTNDAAGAITRLVDMGVQPFLVASSLVGVLAQRLVRVLCPACKKPYVPTAEERDAGGHHRRDPGRRPATRASSTRPQGCPACQNTGYQGRTGIYELMLVDDDIRQLILKNVDSATHQAAAVERGMLTLLEHGAYKVARGHHHRRRGLSRHRGGPATKMPVFEYKALDPPARRSRGSARPTPRRPCAARSGATGVFLTEVLGQKQADAAGGPRRERPPLGGRPGHAPTTSPSRPGSWRCWSTPASRSSRRSARSSSRSTTSSMKRVVSAT